MLDLVGPQPGQALVVIIEQGAFGHRKEPQVQTYGEAMLAALAELSVHNLHDLAQGAPCGDRALSTGSAQ